jgi:hypothetical protein
MDFELINMHRIERSSKVPIKKMTIFYWLAMMIDQCGGSLNSLSFFVFSMYPLPHI